MSEEKEIFGTEAENEEVIETVEEATEEVIEEVAEETAVAEETVEEVVAPAKKVIERVYVCDACQALCETETCQVCGKELAIDECYVCTPATKVVKTKKTKKTVLTTAIAVVAAAFVIWGGMYLYTDVYNPYNNGEYKDLAFGETLGEIAEQSGMDFNTFKKQNGLPKNMAKSTYSNIAQQHIKVKTLADMYGMTVLDYAEMMQVEGEFTDDVTIGELQGEATVAAVFGVDEETFAEVKAEYGLDDSVTLETKFKDVRTQVMKAQYEQSLEAEKAAAEAANITEETAKPEEASEEASEEKAE